MDTKETETAGEEQEEEQGEEPLEEEVAELAPAEKKTEESAKAQEADELKVVIILKGNKVMLGVQSPSCDPVYTTLEGTLTAALKRVPKLVAEAREKWTANPLNPAANLPKPEPTPTPARTPAAPRTKPAQPSFF